MRQACVRNKSACMRSYCAQTRAHVNTVWSWTQPCAITIRLAICSLLAQIHEHARAHKHTCMRAHTGMCDTNIHTCILAQIHTYLHSNGTRVRAHTHIHTLATCSGRAKAGVGCNCACLCTLCKRMHVVCMHLMSFAAHRLHGKDSTTCMHSYSMIHMCTLPIQNQGHPRNVPFLL